MAMNMKKELQFVKKSLETLSKKVEKMVAATFAPEKAKSKVAEAKPKVTKAKPKVAKAKPVKKVAVKKPTAKKTEKLSAPEIVLGIITRSKRDVEIAELKEKSGFQGQKLHSVIYTLKKRGKIKSAGKGVYVKG